MKKYLLRSTSISILMLSLIGCSHIHSTDAYFRNHAYDYRRSHNGHNLLLPPNLSKEKIDRSFNIPEVTAIEKYPMLAPPESLASKSKQAREAFIEETHVFDKHHIKLVLRRDKVVELLLPAKKTVMWTPVMKGLVYAGYKVIYIHESTGRIYFLDEGATNGWLLAATPMYRVQLTDSGQNTVVTLFRALSKTKEEPVSEKEAKVILGRLSAMLRHPPNILERLFKEST